MSTVQFESPLNAFLHWEATRPNAVFLKQPVNGTQLEYTFKAVGEQARKIASVLKSYNFPPRSHIALLSKNCAHWHMADLAIMMSNHVSIPIYPTLNSTSIAKILEHSEAKAVILGKLDTLDEQKAGIPEIPIIGTSLYNESIGESWETLVENNQPLIETPELAKDDLYTIIYTSGTTGNPKGVMHTIGNLMESSNVLISLFQLPDHPRFFSYLPIAHIAERLLETFSFILGAEVTFPESLETFAADLEKTQPHAYFAVPRIWTKFQEKILEKLPQKKLNLLLKIPFLCRLVKHKLKKKLGLKDTVIILSGAAPLAPSLINWYAAIGITIQQVYGMTEDCCISHCNTPEASKVGTVGKALENVEIKLTSEGEICIKNKCLMKGYYKSPDLTSEVFDDDGFFKTGDIGQYDHEKYLTITGRVKDQFKTDKGKYISPAPLELEISKNTDIEQICIVGTGIPQPIALITLSDLGKAKFKKVLVDGLEKTIEQVNPNFEKHERIIKVVVMSEDWTIANGLTTPTLKVKRNSIEKIHQQYYKEWFESSDKVIFEA